MIRSWPTSLPPLSRQQVVFLSQSSCVLTLLTGRGERRGAKPYDCKKSWSFINHLILSGGMGDAWRLLQPKKKTLNSSSSSSNSAKQQMSSLLLGCSVTSHLVSCPNLTHVILPFASDLVLQNISQSPRLVLFQNVYR
jgi:hypothetical protein